MSAPRLTLMERLRIGQAALALALEKKPATAADVVVQEIARRVLPPAEDRSEAIAAARAIEKSPLHVCGIRMVLCADCRAWICKAPGHAIHVCPGFSQVVEEAAP